MTDELRPKDRAEEIALFRAQMLGPVLCRDLKRGKQGFLAGRKVTIARTLVDDIPPWIEYENRRLTLSRLDPVKNAHRKCNKKDKEKTGIDVPFDPPKALLDKMLSRNKKTKRK